MIDFTTTTQVAGPHDAFHGELDCPDTDVLAGTFGVSGLGECDNSVRIGFRDELLTEADDTEYGNIGLSDNTYLQTADPGWGDNAIIQFILNTGFDATDAGNMTDVFLSVEALQGATTADWYLYIWDYNQNIYLRIDAFSTNPPDEIRSATLNGGFVSGNGHTLGSVADLIDTTAGGQMTVTIVNLGTSDWLRVDTASMDITLVPEPGTAALLCLGLIGLSVVGRRHSA